MDSREFNLIDTLELISEHPRLRTLVETENPWTQGAVDLHLPSGRVLTVYSDDGDIVVVLLTGNRGILAQGRASGVSVGMATSMMALGLLVSLVDVDAVIGSNDPR